MYFFMILMSHNSNMKIKYNKFIFIQLFDFKLSNAISLNYFNTIKIAQYNSIKKFKVKNKTLALLS